MSVQLFSTSGNLRLWKLVAGLFLFVGLLAVLERVWTLSTDLYARKNWPSTNGEILSVVQQDDNDLSRRAGSVRGTTRYWVEYEVGFAVPAQQCRTGIIYEGTAETLPCHGIVRTRSTQSTAEVFQWLLHGYQLHQSVTILWDPQGTSSADVKIAGESIWLRYNTDRLVVSLVWVLVFGSLYVFSRRRLEYFKIHPEEQTWPQGPDKAGDSEDSYQLTRLDL